MADKKISQFPTFDGAAGSEVFFVVGSGEADNPNASNYRYPFNNLTTDITKAGSAWITGTDLIYTLTGAVGLGTSAPIYQLDVANTGRFRSDLIVSGDLFVSGTTHIQKIIDVSITGTISGVTGEFADGIFADSLTISGVSVSTGGSIEVPGGGGSIIGGDVSNINFGGTEASDTRAVNFQVGGVDKLVIGSDGDVGIAEDLTVSGSAYVSGNVGIGTDLPGYALSIHNPSPYIELKDTDVGASVFLKNQNGNVYLQADTTNTVADSFIAFTVDDATGMFISGVNVGIGTTSPEHALHVNGHAEAVQVLVQRESSILHSLFSAKNDTDDQVYFGLTPGGSFGVGHSLDIDEEGSFYVTSNGNVGIGSGTTSPTARLHVTGGKILAPSGDFTESLTVSGQPVLTGAGGAGAGGKWLDGLSAGDIYYAGGDVSIGSTFACGALTAKSDAGHVGFNAGTSLSPERGNIFYTTDGTSWGLNIGKYDTTTTAFTPQMTLKTNGYVGIGTTLPLTTLHVSGAAIIQDERVNNFQPVTVANYDSTAASTQTTSLGFGLARDATVPGGVGTQFTQAGVIRVGKDEQWDGDDAHLNAHMSFSTLSRMVSTERVRINSNGDVGIGTGAPAGALHIVNPGANTLTLTRQINVLGIADGAVAKIEGGALSAASPSMGAALGFSLVDVDGAGAGSNTKGHLYFETKDPGGSLTEKMRIDASGNVGIGTADPSYKLEVSGIFGVTNHSNSVAAATFYNGGGSAPATIHIVENDSNGIGTHHVGLFVGSTDLTTGVLVTKNGNVGIGTGDPSSKLEVYSTGGAVNTQIHLHNDSTANAAVLRLEGGRDTISNTIYQDVGQLIFANKGNVTAGIRSYHQGDGSYRYDDGDLRFYTSDQGSSNVLSARMAISKSGNVGIGTTTPSAPLEVNSVSGGVIMPRMTTTQMNAIVSASDGEMIYNTNSGKFAGYEAGSWQPLASASASSPAKYVAPWASSHGGVFVVNSATMIITHNLGTTDVIVSCYINNSASDVGAEVVAQQGDNGGGNARGIAITNLTTNTCTVQLGNAGYTSTDSSGLSSFKNFATMGWIKVVVIG